MTATALFGSFAKSAIGGISGMIINCHNGRPAATSAKLALKFSLDKSDLYSILKEQADAGRWQNDVKEATVKCKAEYGITQLFVFPNPTDLA